MGGGWCCGFWGLGGGFGCLGGLFFFFLSKWQFLGNDDGKFQRGCSCRITREGEQIYDGPLASLKRFKDDVKEVNTSFECGLTFNKFNDVKEGDIVEAFVMEEVKR